MKTLFCLVLGYTDCVLLAITEIFEGEKIIG